MAGHVKGLLLKSRFEYVKQFFGEKGEAALLEAISPEARAMVADGILVSTWYPIDPVIEILVKMDEVFGKGDFELARKMGAHTARMALAGGVQQSFAKENDPAFVLRMGPLLWQQYYDTGRVEVEALGPESAVSRIFEFGAPHRAICMGMLGWIEEAVGIWGGRDVRVNEVKCRTRGDDFCEYTCHWTDPQADTHT